jgi:hypothetical protein
MSKDEFAKIIPVSPPTVNKKIKPIAQIDTNEKLSLLPYHVPTQLKTFTPVGIAIIIVAEVK